MATEKLKKEAEDAVAREKAIDALFAEALQNVENPKAVNYLARRGISMDTARKYNVGFVERWKNPKSRDRRDKGLDSLVFRTGKYSYIARVIDPEFEKDKQRNKRNVGDVYLWNKNALWNATEPIFVTEGVFDALSVCEVGGFAVALDGRNVSPLLREIDKRRPVQPLIIALDDDSAGYSGSKDLVNALTERNIPFYWRRPTRDVNGLKILPDEDVEPDTDDGKIDWQALGGYTDYVFLDDFNDPNDCLANSREDFINCVETAIAEAKIAVESLLTLRRIEVEKDSVGSCLDDIVSKIREGRTAKPISTGFPTFDSWLEGGLYPGLCVIGAISALGKTSLCLQMADNIAKAGHDVLYFSAEMSLELLIKKSLSRYTAIVASRDYKDTRQAKTIYGIHNFGREQQSEAQKAIFNKAVEEYRVGQENLRIYSGSRGVRISDIANRIFEHIELYNRTPVVFIDYLQILKGSLDSSRATDKQLVDDILSELKALCEEYAVPFVVISSFNRTAYNKPVAYDSYKETGSIEYTGDVVIGLQYYGIGNLSAVESVPGIKNAFEALGKGANSERKLQALFDYYKEKGNKGEEQMIQVVILKGRSGRSGNFNLRFFPRFSHFAEASPQTEQASQPRLLSSSNNNDDDDIPSYLKKKSSPKVRKELSEAQIQAEKEAYIKAKDGA